MDNLAPAPADNVPTADPDPVIVASKPPNWYEIVKPVVPIGIDTGESAAGIIFFSEVEPEIAGSVSWKSTLYPAPPIHYNNIMFLNELINLPATFNSHLKNDLLKNPPILYCIIAKTPAPRNA